MSGILWVGHCKVVFDLDSFSCVCSVDQQGPTYCFTWIQIREAAVLMGEKVDSETNGDSIRGSLLTMSVNLGKLCTLSLPQVLPSILRMVIATHRGFSED